MKAQKKPVIVDYFIIWGDVNTIVDLKEWVRSFGDKPEDHFIFKNGGFRVKTLEGTSYEISTEDIILRGIKGEYYPCKEDIFDLTYDKIRS